jgi:hypothetical protein
LRNWLIAALLIIAELITMAHFEDNHSG